MNADVLILCAGLGTRLRPMTLERPKPAVPLMNRPLIGYTLDRVKALGLNRAVINTHWLPDVMREAAEEEARPLGIEIAASHEPEILGTGGGLRQARERGLIARDRHLLVLNGDVLAETDLNKVIETHQRTGAAATMVLRPMPAGASYTPIEADETGRIQRIGKYGKSIGGTPLLFTGAHVLSPEALDLLPAGESGVIERVYAPLLECGARVPAVIDPGVWLDLGDPAGYLDAHRAVLRGEVKSVGRSALSERAKIDPTASLHESVVGADAIVEAGASLDGCVVWPKARVPAGVQWRSTIVTPKTVFHIE